MCAQRLLLVLQEIEAGDDNDAGTIGVGRHLVQPFGGDAAGDSWEKAPPPLHPLSLVEREGYRKGYNKMILAHLMMIRFWS